MFGIIFLTVVLLIGLWLFKEVVVLGLIIAGHRHGGWWGMFGGIGLIIAYVALWCYGVSTAIYLWTGIFS